MTVSIQFCGGCNPSIERGEVARELQQVLVGLGIDVVFNSLDADFVIFLSGCPSDCAFEYNPTDLSHVIVAATAVNGEEVGEAQIVPEVLRKVRQFFERVASGT